MRFYTGVGSRSTPIAVCEEMTRLARIKAREGLTLRSGASGAADEAFEKGAGALKEIWLPWLGFNAHSSALVPTEVAFELAASVHPAWSRCSRGARALHARNCHQILGMDLMTPSEEMICWTPGGEEVGGTATAIRLARRWQIRTTNLGAR